MSKQLLLNEIERIFHENNEKEEDMTNEKYVFTKYAYLLPLFEQYRVKGEKWHQLVREVVVFPKDDLQYMYGRTMQLLRRFLRDARLYFNVKTEIGTYTLPDRLSDLNRLFELYIEFLSIIYPNISRRLRFDVFFQEQESRILRGRILWPRTIRHCISQGSQTCPTTFVTMIPENRFETPENILAILSVLRLKQDSLFLLGYDFQDFLTIEEGVLLGKIADGCVNILKTTLLKELLPIATKYAAMEFEDPRIQLLETASYTRLRGEHETNPYLHLLRWIQKYRELNLRSVSINKTSFPVDRLQNLDTMFEVWVLFEFLDYLQTHERATVSIERVPQKFKISMHGTDFTLFYEKKYSGWAVDANPDFSIERNGELRVIMDAKNWLQPKTEAIYKMLGYLNNLDGTTGILFFPNEVSLGDQRIYEGQELNFHQNQLLFNCVVRPAGSRDAIRRKQDAFRNVAQRIFQSIS